MRMEKFFDSVENITVRYLTYRKAKAAAKKNRNKTVLTEILDWLDAVVFAVFLIFFLNLWFFQFFVIPTPSMKGTINVGERVWVNKNAYGAEAYLQGPKIGFASAPVRDDIITFYNPNYESRGTLFDTLSTVLYMGTLSLVNIDRDESGNIREKLYVKRTVGVGGDVVRIAEGDVYMRSGGLGEFTGETEFRSVHNLSDKPYRSLDAKRYDGIKAWGRLKAFDDAGISQKNVPSHLLFSYSALSDHSVTGDLFEFDRQRTIGNTQVDPSSVAFRSEAAMYANGYYVPSGYFLPLGDNRDNSGDGRYFGPVSSSKVNGKVTTIVWPLSRIGKV